MNKITRRQFGKNTALLAVATSALAMPALEGCSTSWIATIEADLPEFTSIATSIISIIGLATGNGGLSSAAAPIVTAAVTLLQTSLKALQDAVTAYNNGKGQGTVGAIDSAITTVLTNASGVITSLTGVGVNISPGLQTSIVSGIGLIATVLSAIKLILPGAVVPASVSMTAKSTVKASILTTAPPNKTQIKTGYNAVLVLNGFASDQI